MGLGPRTDRQSAEGSGQWVVDSGQWTVNRGLWDSGTVGQWDSGTVGRGQCRT